MCFCLPEIHLSINVERAYIVRLDLTFRHLKFKQIIILLPLVANHKKNLNPKSDFAADIAPLTKFTVLLRIKRKSLFHYRYKP